MAQLNNEMADKVANTTDPNALIDEGVYLVRLNGKVESKDSQSGNAVWTWPFVIEPGQPFAGRKINHRTVIMDSMFWRLKQTFDAFGVPTSTDTDELEGKLVRISTVVKEDYKGELDKDGLIKLVPDIREVLSANGPTGVNEAAKLRREKLREEALKALEESGAAASTADGDGLF